MATRIISANTPFQTNALHVGIEIRPAEGVSPNATLSYSVSGEDEHWTSHSTVLTDKVNTVCNVPRNMYLKLNQDCVITEI